MFHGRHCVQDEDFNVHVSMKKIIEERLAPVKVAKGKSGDGECSPGELQASSSCTRALSRLKCDDVEIKQLAKHAKGIAELGITARSIPLEKL
eukprot:7531867-Pyramimonas_sp.AAC.1